VPATRIPRISDTDLGKRQPGSDIRREGFADAFECAADLIRRNIFSRISGSLARPTTLFLMTADSSNLSIDRAYFFNLMTVDTIITWQAFTPQGERQLPARADFQIHISDIINLIK
jgi:hypothetical protein